MSDTLRLNGDLTAAEVSALYRRHFGPDADRPPARIDLSGIERADSSALALLLAWRALAGERGIEFLQPPTGLRAMAQVSEISTLLGWAQDREQTA